MPNSSCSPTTPWSVGSNLTAPARRPIGTWGCSSTASSCPSARALGDLDPKRNGSSASTTQPADPWQHQQMIVLQNTETQELFTFSTSSKTGRRAVGNLLRHYTRMRKTHPDELPVIRLGKGGFEHKDKRVGFVDTPVFVVVGRAPRDSATKPDTSVGAFLDDEIPLW